MKWIRKKIYGKQYAKVLTDIVYEKQHYKENYEVVCYQQTPSSFPTFIVPVALIHNWLPKYSAHLYLSCVPSLLGCNTEEEGDIICFHHLCIPRTQNNACYIEEIQYPEMNK